MNKLHKNSPKERLRATYILLSSTMVFGLMLLDSLNAFCQNGNAGITQAASEVNGYFKDGTDLMYKIGAIVGLVGAIKVFNKWNSGDPDTGKVAAAWFGSCVFLVVVATVLKGFFGV